MRSYHALTNQIVKDGEYSLVPIRDEDRYDIMTWRNEQMYHLRQSEVLTRQAQDKYFDVVISALFIQKEPNQILFSYLKGEKCIGYGGLVHINWIDKNAEISFVMDTELEHKNFIFHWKVFLALIENVAFQDLKFHKIFTYAFDIRPKLYTALENGGFKEEARLIDHCCINEKFRDVLIHSKINFRKTLSYKKAEASDVNLLFKWANDSDVRSNSLNPDPIKWVDHMSWFNNKLSHANSRIYIFYFEKKPIGQVRLDFENDTWLIDYSVDKKERGKGYGTLMIRRIINIDDFKKVKALVKYENMGSSRVFQKLGFESLGIKNIKGQKMIEFLYQQR